MKKFMYSILVASALFVSCGSDDSEETVTQVEGFAGTPVSGVVYNDDFTIGGGMARPIILNTTESLYIHLSPTAINCESSNLGPIWITVPARTGTFTPATGGTLQFQDEADGGFEGATDAEIEIISISATTVTGRVKASGFYETENNINGTFTVQYCPN